MNQRNKRRFFVLLGVSVFLLSSCCLHGEFRLSSTLNLSGEYTDRPLHRSTNKDLDSFITIINPSLTLQFLNGENELSANYSFLYTYYDDPEVRDNQSKYHHNGRLRMNLLLTKKLKFEVTSNQRYSDLDSIIDTDQELDYKTKVFRSFNNANLTYNYGPQRDVGIRYNFTFFKYFGDVNLQKEQNNSQGTGFSLNHAFDTRNSIMMDYSYNFGKFYVGDEKDYIGRKRIHVGNFSYKFRINKKLTISLSYLPKYWEYPDEDIEGDIYIRKHTFHEFRGTLGYVITEKLTSSYWIGYNKNESEFKDDIDRYDNMTGGLDFSYQLRRLSLNIFSSYQVRETLYYTSSERRGSYKSLSGGLNANLELWKDFFIFRLYANARNDRYRNKEISTEEFRSDKIYYMGGEFITKPFRWLDISCGYNRVTKDSNDRDDIFNYTENRVYLNIGITFTPRLDFDSTGFYQKSEPERII